MHLEKLIEDNVEAIDTLARECRIEPTQVRQVVSEITPTLITGLRETAKNEHQVDEFFHEFEGDHFDVLLTEPEHLIDRENILKGNEVLEYILKSRDVSRRFADIVGEHSGIEATTVRKILPIVATMLMGVLTQTKVETVGKGEITKKFLKLLDENRDGSLWKELNVK